jgi:tetratricopeptide (TPR) repeat protein
MHDLAAALARDPARRRRQIFAAVGVAAALVAAGAGAVRASRGARVSCGAGGARFETVWESADHAGAGSRRLAARAAVMVAGTSEPEKTWERVAAVLDRHAARWADAYRDACEATHVRGEQSAEALDLRMECLNDNLESTRALTELLARGGRGIVERAAEVAGGLEDLGRCRDVEQLRAGVRPPTDPLIRQAVDEQRKTLKDAEALRAVGDLKRAREVVDQVLARPAAASFAPLRAEALLLEGMIVTEMMPMEGAAWLERALFAAESCGDDRVVATAAGALVFASKADAPRVGERWVGLASAALARIGGDAQLESWLANNLGGLRYQQRRWEDARREFARAVTLKERMFGADHIEVAKSLANLAAPLTRLGRSDEALIDADRALAIEERWMSADSLFLGYALCNRAEVLRAKGRFDDASADYRRSLEIFRKWAPDDNNETIEAMAGLASVALDRGSFDEAVADLERVLAVRVRDGITGVDLAETQFQLAIALDRAGRDPTRARTLATQAFVAYGTRAELASEHREVERWLDARRRAEGASPLPRALPKSSAR